jgi:hypothetical protein
VILDELLDIKARVVCFPVRHHSPTCARLVRDLVRQMRPAAVLIEGPADFNDRLPELDLPHRLPIAIYSYVRLADGQRRGAYYPFCVYSPEWQALRAAREIGAAVRFIDLPWSAVAETDRTANRYADAELRRGAYVAELCRQLGVEGFDALWDALFESQPRLTLEAFLRRCHHFCLHCRLLEEQVAPADRQREAFMAQQVRNALKEFNGRLLVVTGGYHSAAIHARLTGQPFVGVENDGNVQLSSTKAECGIALTPYSYERLDSLTGYEAGMPNPGFYHQVWQDQEARHGASHRHLLTQVVKMLRQRRQPISAADLIGVEATAQGLARLRGHEQVWRRDLVDGITGALIKEELALGMSHPLLDAVHEVFRGGERGMLAEGATLPPLVLELRRLLTELDLEPQMRPRTLELELEKAEDRTRSRILHRLSILEIAGFDRQAGADLVARDDLSRIWERWQIRWGPEYEATSIEASRYGPALAEAAAAYLEERAAKLERDADQAARLLLQASLAGLSSLAKILHQRLAELVRGDADFVAVTRALSHLVYLYRFDRVLETAGRSDLGDLLRETFGRGLWLLETLGQVSGRDKELLQGVRSLLEAFERCAEPLALSREEFVEVLGRVHRERGQGPVIRGAATGALWNLGACGADGVRTDLQFFADPDKLGDYLAGLFCLAREVIQRQPDLVSSIDTVVLGYTDEEFLTAVPALRLAFTFFTPREKHHLALTLLEALDLKEVQPLTMLEYGPEVAARALAFEARLFAAMERYGVRGGTK